jgi:hypothetical protein
MADALISGPVLRPARVLGVPAGRGTAELEILEGPLAGRTVAGVFYPEMGPAPARGAAVLANTVGLEMELGTGGVAIILPTQGGEVPENENHFVKLPYTPLQFPVPPAPQAEDLAGVPVVVLPLHSHLAPACCAAADLRPGCQVVFVWQEGGALPVAFSRSVPVLRDKDLLHAVVSCGNCFGGDLESPNVYSGLLAAAVDADLVLVGIGPGVVGTASAGGHGGMSAAVALNAACSLGARPVLAPRLSEADARGRHRGLSHHTRDVLSAALGECRVVVPGGFRDTLGTADIPDRHPLRDVGYGASGLEGRFGVTFESMGRRYEQDPVFFDAAAAAVALALRGEPA